MPQVGTQVPSCSQLLLALVVFVHARSGHHADEVPAAFDLLSCLRRVRLGSTLVQVVHADGGTALASADGQSSSLRLAIDAAWIPLRSTTEGRQQGGVRSAGCNLARTRLQGIWQHAGVSVYQPGQRDEQAFGAAQAKRHASSQWQALGQLQHFFGAAGVVVPTSLPKLLYRKLLVEP